MFFYYFITVIVIIYIFIDLNYVIRTVFTVWSGRIYQKYFSLIETTTIYGCCTFQDCDVSFRNMRLARLVRELDFARYHFYDRTRIYLRSRQHKIRSLQGSTFAIFLEPIPLFTFYKIHTKLVYWDERSLFLEHNIVTLHDGRVRCVLISRQFGLGKDNGPTTDILLDGLPGFDTKRKCPEYITSWLQSMNLSSEKLRKQV